MNQPIISIDRQSRTYAIFEGNVLQIVRDFQPYANEQEALNEATAWVASKTAKLPTVVYPRITKLGMLS